MNDGFDYATPQRAVVDSVLRLVLGAGRTASVSGESGNFDCSTAALDDAQQRLPFFVGEFELHGDLLAFERGSRLRVIVRFKCTNGRGKCQP